MKEEVDCLQVMIQVLKDQKDYQAKLRQLPDSIQAVVKIQEAGFLEPFVLLNRADNDIAQDYVSYRSSHRDRVYAYLDENVVPRKPVADKP